MNFKEFYYRNKKRIPELLNKYVIFSPSGVIKDKYGVIIIYAYTENQAVKKLKLKLPEYKFKDLTAMPLDRYNNMIKRKQQSQQSPPTTTNSPQQPITTKQEDQLSLNL